MTPKEFTIWMKGFITACPKFHPTPEQWDLLKDQLQKVENQTPKTKLQYPPILRGTTTHTGMPVFDQGTKELING
jgi:hypothetical protein